MANQLLDPGQKVALQNKPPQRSKRPRQREGEDDLRGPKINQRLSVHLSHHQRERKKKNKKNKKSQRSQRRHRSRLRLHLSLHRHPDRGVHVLPQGNSLATKRYTPLRLRQNLKGPGSAAFRANTGKCRLAYMPLDGIGSHPC